jgi:hypothetical protein
MSEVIRISEATYEGLESLARGFDTPGNVIDRLLDYYMRHNKNIIPHPTTHAPEIEKKKRFLMGISDEVINIRALQTGKQIVSCKTHKKNNPYIFLVAKGSFKSDFEPSEEGHKLMHEPIVESDISRHVAKIEYLSIPGKNRNFWQELYDGQEFNLWSIDSGPLMYFNRSKKNKMLLWIFRVYEMPFEIKVKVDFKPPHMNNTSIHKPATLEKIQVGFDNGEFTPVISDADFERRTTRIKEIADKYL